VNGTNLVTNGGGISGAAASTLTINNAQTTNSGNYTVVVTGPGGSTNSSVAALIVTSAPVITKQPTSLTNSVGATATFDVTAVGKGPLHYQWWVNGTNKLVNGTNSVYGAAVITSGAANNVLTIKNAQLTNSGRYTVIITNIAGSVTSSVAVLTMTNSPLEITLQPTNQTVGVGSAVTFNVLGSGGAPPIFMQWWKDGVSLVNGTTISGSIISGATTNVLTISNAQTNDSGSYWLVVMTGGGTVTSSNAVLTVVSSPFILTQPADRTVAMSSNATFTVTAIGLPPLSYQWRVNGTNLMDGTNLVAGDITSGSTTTNLTISNVPVDYNSNFYSVIVTNQFGSATSSNALLTVATAPVITVQPTPTNQVVLVNSNATFAVTAVGIAPLSYQWQINGTNLMDGTNLAAGDITSGSTTTNLIISNAQTNNSATNYTVVVTNIAGSVTSSVVSLTVAPTILTLQPTNQTVPAGSTVTFSVDGYSVPPFHLQWKKDGADLGDGGRISGTTEATLVITNAQTTDDGTYWIVVSNAWGVLDSSNAVLTVIPSSPSFGKIIAAGEGGFILSGAGGGSNGTYYILMSSNLLAPLTNWTYIATDHFDGAGAFSFTNAAPTNAPQEFYLLQMP